MENDSLTSSRHILVSVTIGFTLAKTLLRLKEIDTCEFGTARTR